MQQILEKKIHHSGNNIHMIQSKKFKTVSVVVKYRASLNRDTITKRALVPYLLNQGTRDYPSEKALQSKLDELYGAFFSIDGMKKGDSHIISFRLECANDVFIDNETTLLNEALNLLHEIIYHPYLEDNHFPEDILKREKETLRNEIESVIDNKMTYANMRLLDEMYKDDIYSLHVHGYEKDLDKLTAEDIYEYYKSMLIKDEFDIYILGQFDETKMYEQLTNLFPPVDTRIDVKEIYEEVIQIETIKEVIEIQPIQQAKLHIGYKTFCTFKDDDYFALHILNGLFGGFPNSKLFVNVREKNSLAYYASSRLESHKGLLIVFSGIEGKNYEQARDIIEMQMKAMKEGDFTEEELNETKELVISQIKETLDSPQSIIELLYQQVLGAKALTPNEFIENISNVTKQDVIAIAKRVQEHTIYLLKNESGE